MSGILNKLGLVSSTDTHFPLLISLLPLCPSQSSLSAGELTVLCLCVLVSCSGRQQLL